MKSISISFFILIINSNLIFAIDSIFLKNGKTITGKIKSYNTGNEVTIETKNGLKSYSKDLIESIELDDSTTDNTKKSGEPYDIKEKALPPEYRTLLEVGYPWFYYHDEQDKDTVANIGKHNEISRFKIALDGGFYVRYLDSFMMGANITWEVDRFSSPNKYVQLNFLQYSYSVIMFPLKEWFDYGSLGDGIFIRGDIGLAQGVQINQNEWLFSTPGIGFVLGAGYGLSVTQKQSITVSLNFHGRFIGNRLYSGLTLSGGVLF